MRYYQREIYQKVLFFIWTSLELNYNIRERYPIKSTCKRKWMVGRTTPSFNELKHIPFSDINFEAKIHVACSSYSKLIPGKHIHTWENELFPMIDDKCTIFRGWKTILCNDQNDWTLQTDTRYIFSISISLVEHLFQIDFWNSCCRFLLNKCRSEIYQKLSSKVLIKCR